jgi:hypothetical protein
MMNDDFNPQISQITQITKNVRWRLRNLPGLIPRSLQRRLRALAFGDIAKKRTTITFAFEIDVTG